MHACMFFLAQPFLSHDIMRRTKGNAGEKPQKKRTPPEAGWTGNVGKVTS